MKTEPGAPYVDSCELIRALAKWANMDVAPIRRMVLVLDVDAVPVMYVESYLDETSMPQDVEKLLKDAPPPVIADRPYIAKTVVREGG